MDGLEVSLRTAQFQLKSVFGKNNAFVQIRSMRNTFPELQPLGNITCPILNAIKNRIPVTLAILGQTYHVSFFPLFDSKISSIITNFKAKCHIVNRLFNDVVISQEALMGLTEGRMMRFNYGVENHAEINGPGSYVVLDIFPTDSESDGYDSDSSRGIPPKEKR